MLESAPGGRVGGKRQGKGKDFFAHPAKEALFPSRVLEACC